MVFSTAASDLIAGDTNFSLDVFLKNLRTGALRLVSSNSSGVQGRDSSYSAVFSPDGGKIAFTSYSSNLVSGDRNGSADVFLKDLTTNSTRRVSVKSSGTQLYGDSGAAFFSPDGKKIGFVSRAPNVVFGDGDGDDIIDVFYKDLMSGRISKVSISEDGRHGDQSSLAGTFSPSSTKVAFDSLSNNFASSKVQGGWDVYIKDISNGAIAHISVSRSGVDSPSDSSDPVFFPSGRKVMFTSDALNLVSGDTNFSSDIFVVNLREP